MSGSHKSLLVRHIGPLLVFGVIRRVFLFFFFFCFVLKMASCCTLNSEENVLNLTLLKHTQQAESGCCKLIDDCVGHLKKEVSAPQLPAPSPVAQATISNGGNTSSRLVNGSADSVSTVGEGQVAGPPTLSSRQERLDTLMDGYVVEWDPLGQFGVT